ncbi:MAG: macro domain-containing protein [Myxococcota bacterium]
MTDRLQLIHGDITTLDDDVIVNAANSSLLGGGGVDGAIHRAAGRELLEFCRTLGGARTGEVKLSPGFRLKAKVIAHAVGPVWRGGTAGEDGQLISCYRRALELTVGAGFHTVAFPAISTGVYGFPFERATRLALATVREALATEPRLTRVTLCFFSAEELELARQLAAEPTEGPTLRQASFGF